MEIHALAKNNMGHRTVNMEMKYYNPSGKDAGKSFLKLRSQGCFRMKHIAIELAYLLTM